MESTAIPLPASVQATHFQPTSDSLNDSLAEMPTTSQPAPYGSAAADSDPYTRRERTNSTSSRHSRLSRAPTKEVRDPNLDTNLPYRTLSPDANLAEYTTEVPAGEMTGPAKPDGAGYYKLVTFTPGDPENPKNWSKAYKWYCTMVVAITCFVVAFCSSVITADIEGVMETFNVSEEAALVSITVFVVGFGVGKSWHSHASW
jgi:Ca2+/H+ antiporter